MPKSYGFAQKAVYDNRQTSGCGHTIEAHVAYDMEASGYRALLRCRCGEVRIGGNKVCDTYLQAEMDSKTWLQRKGITA